MKWRRRRKRRNWKRGEVEEEEEEQRRNKRAGRRCGGEGEEEEEEGTVVPPAPMNLEEVTLYHLLRSSSLFTSNSIFMAISSRYCLWSSSDSHFLFRGVGEEGGWEEDGEGDAIVFLFLFIFVSF